MKILLCDSQTLFRTGLARLLDQEPDLDVVATVGTVRFAVEAARSLAPEVAITDSVLPDGNALDLTVRLLLRSPDIRIVVIPSDPASVPRAASGVGVTVARTSGVERVIEVLRHPERTPAGGRRLEPNLGPALLPAAGSVARQLDLDFREWQILRLVTAGVRNRDIAAALDMREKTVRNLLTSLYERLGVRSRTQAALAVLRLGLLLDEPPSGDV